MKTLKFRNDLKDLILNGEKTKTWRVWGDDEMRERNIRPGDIVEFIVWETGEKFATAEITHVASTKFRYVTDSNLEGAGHEKFASDKELYLVYSHLYNTKITGDTDLRIFRFELQHQPQAQLQPPPQSAGKRRKL